MDIIIMDIAIHKEPNMVVEQTVVDMAIDLLANILMDILVLLIPKRASNLNNLVNHIIK